MTQRQHLNTSTPNSSHSPGQAHKQISASLLVVLSLIIQSGIAQTIETRFTHLSGATGVSLGRINAISQDQHGMIWFSDETHLCVTRYDGARMTRYAHDPLDNNSLGGAHPECITPDTTGIIWIGLYGSGLDRFDPETNTFTHFRHHPDDPGSLSSDSVTAVVVDHLGNLWIGTYAGLDRLDQKTGKFTHYRNDKRDPASLSSSRVRAVYEDREGTLWVGTSYVWDPSDDGGLNRFDRATGTFTRFLHDPKNPRSLINNKVRAIFEDSRGTFWIGTAGDGLHTMDRKTGLFERHQYDPTKPDKLSRPPLRTYEDHITFIKEDTYQNIWIGTFKNGVNRFDPATQRVTHFGGTPGRTNDVADFSFWAALLAKDGRLWLSTQEDNTYLVESIVSFPRFREANTYHNAFFQESPSVIWFGTDRGIVRKDLNTGLKSRITHDPLNPNSLGYDIVSGIYKDRQGIYWFGGPQGLDRYDPVSKVFRHFRHDPRKPESVIGDWTLETMAATDTSLWVLTSSGLDLLNLKTFGFTHFLSSPNDTLRGTSFVSSLLPDKSNGLWVGTWNEGGIKRLNPQTGNFKVYLQGQSVIALCRDRNDNLWAGAQHGLYRYDAATDTFSLFDTDNILGTVNDVRSLVIDNENYIWVATLSALFRINPERNQVVQFGRDNGILAGANGYRSILKKDDGEIFIGGLEGYYSFYPSRIKLSSYPAKLLLSRLFVQGEPVIPSTNGPIQQPVSVAKEISLRYDQNVFSIDLATIDFSDPALRIGHYMLENYDKTWRSFSSEERVHYFNVPPGHYVFRVKVSNQANGSIAEKKVDVNISPPWWRTFWANGIFVLMFGAVVYSAHRIQKRRVIQVERERTREMELSQAREIEKAYHELKMTQDQLIQSEKMASLGELTAGIAHEIQNPLNFVKNFSEVNSELIAEMKAEIDKGNLNEVKAIADSIDENEQKVIFHGKRADAIVKGMLQHSRSSSGVKESTDINALADEYLRLAYHGLRAKDKSFNATMKTEFDPTIGKINIVPQDIGRVILNLITNAFFAASASAKAAADASAKVTADTVRAKVYEPTVTVSTRKLDRQVEIRVRDNGSGIPQKVLDKIFQPFFTTKPAGQGTGLGLSLSYDIIKAHGGQLKVETKEGEFAEFIVLLPLG